MPISLKEFQDRNKHLDPLNIIISPDVWRLEPECAVAVMGTISAWTHIEHELNMFIANHLLKADFRVTCEFALDMNWGRKRRTIVALSDELLRPQDADLVARVMDMVHGPANDRHHFGHGMWGKIEQVSGHVFLFSSKDVTRDMITGTRITREGMPGFVSRDTDKLRGEATLYSLGDLEEVLNEAKRAGWSLNRLQRAIGENGDPPTRAALDQELPPRP